MKQHGLSEKGFTLFLVNAVLLGAERKHREPTERTSDAR